MTSTMMVVTSPVNRGNYVRVIIIFEKKPGNFWVHEIVSDPKVTSAIIVD